MTVYLVCGGRDFSDVSAIRDALNSRSVTAIVHGGAKGADSLAGSWAQDHGIAEIVINPQWRFYGKSAGAIRNGWMLEFVRVDEVLAFKGSTGTANMVRQARVAGIPVTAIR